MVQDSRPDDQVEALIRKLQVFSVHDCEIDIEIFILSSLLCFFYGFL